MSYSPKIALSLFDGMSCGQLALQRAGISVDYYLASEVDQPAMAVAKKNFPEMEHIGDVREVDGTAIVNPFILMGGSPCQSFSFAGKRKGMSTEQGEEVTTLERYLELKQEGFQFSGQSYLFWEYVRVLKESEPRYFLLENVVMDPKWAWAITDTLGVRPLLIDSACVSIQTRKRLYWTNIPAVESPLGAGPVIGDIWELGPQVWGRNITPDVVRRKNKDAPGRADASVFRNIRTLVDKVPCLLRNDYYTNNGVPLVQDKAGDVWFPSPEFLEACQTVPLGYSATASNTARRHMLGNGWTVDVIAHILSHIPEAEK